MMLPMNLQELIDQLPAQAANLERTLLDPRLPRGANPALSLALEQDWRGTLSGHEWRFRAGVAGAASVSVFANAADEDPDHVIGTPARKAANRAPVLVPAPGLAWLKLAAVGDARVNF